LPWYRWPIEIDGLPSYKNGDFPWQNVSHNQMVYLLRLGKKQGSGDVNLPGSAAILQR